MVEELENLSKEISELIHEKLGHKEKIDVRHIAPFWEWNNVKFKNTVLILGLNPSSADIDSTGKANNCFVHYYPEAWIGEMDYHIVNGMKRKGYTYNKYFKKPYEVFLPYGYRPIWTNKTYLEAKRNELTASEYNVLKKNEDTEKYSMFSDLINYKEKTAKEIERIINASIELEEKVIELFELQIKFFNAKLIFINNAYASRLVTKFISNKLGIENKVYTNIDYYGTKIVFSAILTGVRAMDNFSFERVKQEIDTLI